IEKAHPDVMNLFYQVFDKGELADGESRMVDFRNTFILMTSNLATDEITEMGQREPRDVDDVTNTIRPILARHFKPALLARMQVIPFWPLGQEDLKGVVGIKLGKLEQRVKDSQGIVLTYDETVREQIAERCTEVGTGARNADHIINESILPPISTEVLERISSGVTLSSVHISVASTGKFEFCYG
ncbi:MAG: AAA family ATPase, partial [Pseudomonadota bacterium]